MVYFGVLAGIVFTLRMAAEGDAKSGQLAAENGTLLSSTPQLAL